jgi:DNA repair exonuclease SbcCD ATPase subunit
MSDLKRSCPGCDAWTSSVGAAFRDGEPCPYCGLPAEAAHAIDEARERHASEVVVKRLADAEVRAAKAEAEVDRLTSILNRVREATQV